MKLDNRINLIGSTVVFVALLFSDACFATESSRESLVIAEQGGVTVTMDEVDAMIMSLPPTLRAGYLTHPKRIQAALSAMLLDKQTAAMAEEVGLLDQFYEAKVKLAAERYIASEVRANYIAGVVKNMPSFDLPAEEYYRAHPGEFETPVELDLVHILVKHENIEAETARQRVESARIALGDASRSDQDVVLAYSDDTSQDGILKAVRPNQLTPELESEAFKLAVVGQVSPVVESPFGFHVVKLLNRKEASKRSFEEVREELIEKLKKQYIEKKKSDLADRLRGKPMRADPALLRALRTRYKSAAEGTLENEPAPSGLLSPHEFSEDE